MRRVWVAGDTYTILLSGEQTAGRFCLIDMHVPPGGGGPPLHRHDFEETFSILEGEIEFTVRGETIVARAGDTANMPANAPHAFRNASSAPARTSCLCSPAGQEEFFMAIGDPANGRTAPPPPLECSLLTVGLDLGRAARRSTASGSSHRDRARRNDVIGWAAPGGAASR